MNQALRFLASAVIVVCLTVAARASQGLRVTVGSVPPVVGMETPLVFRSGTTANVHLVDLRWPSEGGRGISAEELRTRLFAIDKNPASIQHARGFSSAAAVPDEWKDFTLLFLGTTRVIDNERFVLALRWAPHGEWKEFWVGGRGACDSSCRVAVTE